MLTQGVITAPFSDRILKSGAVGYGWLNAGWAIGAFYERDLHAGADSRHRDIAAPWEFPWRCWALSLISLPFLGAHVHGWLQLSRFTHREQWPWLVCVTVYCLMGCCRALGGVAITSTMMELVPKHFMGRVQNTFLFSGNSLQLVFSFTVGTVSHTRSAGAGICDCRRNLSAGVSGRLVAGNGIWLAEEAGSMATVST